MTDRLKRPLHDFRGYVLGILLVAISIIAIMAFALYFLWESEVSRTHRLKFTEMVIKAAEGAAEEVTLWFRAGLGLAPFLEVDPFISALFTEKELGGISRTFDKNELRIFDIAAEEGIRIKEITARYEDFKPVIENVSGDPEVSGIIEPDLFERRGALAITIRASVGQISRTYFLRKDIRVINTLAPVVSKFTLYTKGKKGKINRLIGDSNRDLAIQGIIETKTSNSLCPLVLINHPGDVREVQGRKESYREIRDFSNEQERIPLFKKGWVMLGDRDGEWRLNLTPGHPNPDPSRPYPPEKAPYFFGEAFALRQSYLKGTIDSSNSRSLHRYFNFDPSRIHVLHISTDIEEVKHSPWPGDIVEPPGGIEQAAMNAASRDAASIPAPPLQIDRLELRFWDYGISSFYATRDSGVEMLENYFARNPGHSAYSSLLQLAGDIQPTGFAGGNISGYLDRRSPTLVLGPVTRRFLRLLELVAEPAGNLSNPQMSEYSSYFEIVNGVIPPGNDSYSWDSDWKGRRLLKLVKYDIGQTTLSVDTVTEE